MQRTILSLVFLTNNFTLPALIIAAIYRRRWEIELFFRWIKQHLRLRGFFSTSPRRRCPDLDGICSYLLVAIAKRELALPGQSSSGFANCVDLGTLRKCLSLSCLQKTIQEKPPFDNPIQLELK